MTFEARCGAIDGHAQAPSWKARPCATLACGTRSALDAAAVENARRAHQMITRRSDLFGPKLFPDPSWNMLLDLFISEADGRALSVTAACIGARASHSTGIHHLKVLCAAGLAERHADPCDRRRVFVRLTDEARKQLQSLFKGRILRVEAIADPTFPSGLAGADPEQPIVGTAAAADGAPRCEPEASNGRLGEIFRSIPPTV